MDKRILLIAIISAAFLNIGGAQGMDFADCSDAWGLTEPLKGIMAHAAACGDIDGDGDMDFCM